MDEEAKSEDGILYYNFAVPAGFPSPALDHLEERINLNKEYIKHPLSTFLVDCFGTSMIDAFIPPKSKLIIDKSLAVKNGDIVFAVLDGEFTVKQYKKKGNKYWLCAANKGMRDIEITAETNMQIWGVVTTILINTNDVKPCMP